jgi:hypothetical protein
MRYLSFVRSPISLAILFIALAGLSIAGGGGLGMNGVGHLSPGAYGLAGVLVVAGLLVLTRMRIAYYVGIAAGILTALSGVVAWAAPAMGARFALPIHPGISMVVGLYLVMRVALAHRLFGKREPITPDA